MLQKNPSLKGKSISLPIVTNGITHGISLAADLFAAPGDVVIMTDMFWGNYNLTLAVRHGIRIEKYPFFNGSGYNVEGLRQAIVTHQGQGKLIVSLNFPNNPTGYAVTTAEAKAIAEVLVEAADGGCHIVVLCDDAYFDLFYEDDVCPESVFAYLAGRHERLLAIKLDGATKEDFVWGLRLGFITFATGGGHAEVLDALEKKTGGAIRGNISNCSHLSQTILLKAMADPNYETQKQAKRAVMKARAQKVKAVLSDAKFDAAWTMYPFNAGYFMCVQLKNLDAESYRQRLLAEQGIGVIAAGTRDIRIAFSCVEVDDIQALFDAMLTCALGMQA
jgi:aspartate/methionine/tyrosine aminotransferase